MPSRAGVAYELREIAKFLGNRIRIGTVLPVQPAKLTAHGRGSPDKSRRLLNESSPVRKTFVSGPAARTVWIANRVLPGSAAGRPARGYPDCSRPGVADSHTILMRRLALITVVFWVAMFAIALVFTPSPRELPPRESMDELRRRQPLSGDPPLPLHLHYPCA